MDRVKKASGPAAAPTSANRWKTHRTPVHQRINILRGEHGITGLLHRPRIADGLFRRFHGAWSPTSPLDATNPRLSDTYNRFQR